MDVRYLPEPFPHVIVDDMYNSEELNFIWKELDFIQTSNNFLDPYTSGGAMLEGKVLKNNYGIYLDHRYKDRDSSLILKISRKLWHEDIVRETQKHWALTPHFEANLDYSLLSYYKNSNYYKPHIDAACLTAITWFYKKPKMFDGGDLAFNIGTGYDVECKDNRMILFPSSIPHQVYDISLDDVNYPEHGRWAMSQFIMWRFEE
jgi:Rps23 Pro-64 3,4-dihydroxylase Tpa1-like proline 4-hydroxylase